MVFLTIVVIAFLFVLKSAYCFVGQIVFQTGNVGLESSVSIQLVNLPSFPQNNCFVALQFNEPYYFTSETLNVNKVQGEITIVQFTLQNPQNLFIELNGCQDVNFLILRVLSVQIPQYAHEAQIVLYLSDHLNTVLDQITTNIIPDPLEITSFTIEKSSNIAMADQNLKVKLFPELDIYFKTYLILQIQPLNYFEPSQEQIDAISPSQLSCQSFNGISDQINCFYQGNQVYIMQSSFYENLTNIEVEFDISGLINPYSLSGSQLTITSYYEESKQFQLTYQLYPDLPSDNLHVTINSSDQRCGYVNNIEISILSSFFFLTNQKVIVEFPLEFPSLLVYNQEQTVDVIGIENTIVDPIFTKESHKIIIDQLISEYRASGYGVFQIINIQNPLASQETSTFIITMYDTNGEIALRNDKNNFIVKPLNIQAANVIPDSNQIREITQYQFDITITGYSKELQIQFPSNLEIHSVDNTGDLIPIQGIKENCVYTQIQNAITINDFLINTSGQQQIIFKVGNVQNPNYLCQKNLFTMKTFDINQNVIDDGETDFVDYQILNLIVENFVSSSEVPGETGIYLSFDLQLEMECSSDDQMKIKFFQEDFNWNELTEDPICWINEIQHPCTQTENQILIPSFLQSFETSINVKLTEFLNPRSQKPVEIQSIQIYKDSIQQLATLQSSSQLSLSSTNAFQNLNLEATNFELRANNQIIFKFSNSVSLIASDKIEIQFPVGFNVQNINCYGIQGIAFSDSVISDQILTLSIETILINSESNIKIKCSNVVNPLTQTIPEFFQIEAMDFDNHLILKGEFPNNFEFEPILIQEFNVNLSDHKIAQVGDQIIEFEVQIPINVGGFIHFSLPDDDGDFNYQNMEFDASHQLWCENVEFTEINETQIKLTSNQILEEGTYEFKLNNIQNPINSESSKLKQFKFNFQTFNEIELPLEYGNYTLDFNFQCDSTCKECLNHYQFCTSCESNKILEQNQCLESCLSNWFVVEGICVKCQIQNCLICETYEICKICDENFEVANDESGTCQKIQIIEQEEEEIYQQEEEIEEVEEETTQENQEEIQENQEEENIEQDEEEIEETDDNVNNNSNNNQNNIQKQTVQEITNDDLITYEKFLIVYIFGGISLIILIRKITKKDFNSIKCFLAFTAIFDLPLMIYSFIFFLLHNQIFYFFQMMAYTIAQFFQIIFSIFIFRTQLEFINLEELNRKERKIFKIIRALTLFYNFKISFLLDSKLTNSKVFDMEFMQNENEKRKILFLMKLRSFLYQPILFLILCSYLIINLQNLIIFQVEFLAYNVCIFAANIDLIQKMRKELIQITPCLVKEMNS